MEHLKEFAPLAFLARLEERPLGWWQGDTNYLGLWTKELILVKERSVNHDPEQNRTEHTLALLSICSSLEAKGLQDEGPARWADSLSARTCKAWCSELQILTCKGPFWLRGAGKLLLCDGELLHLSSKGGATQTTQTA